ncbi:prepilin-type N-terminal cleavage/methylation domain-containing protein [Polaromonas sp. SP1]|uniref:PilW family protein n=1 Tax=Polaromonas sp. SP1 TaxID=2268087 RepID=UPI000F074C2B|nr:PilW family protein [Polaromonas sp. SP1]AYQ29010.1 prepilin-type N-terminal cleavage/methylation domain-containing protein [Polaromonas sp. SP1]QGJ19871.1 prepilin-type N-terminal cleavage/methylation domain-containing protein [Polaromonas sp. Pch-P]
MEQHRVTLQLRAKGSFHTSKSRGQSGLTLVELLVALVISLVIALAAVSSLIVSRRGLTTVDAAAQLGDNARFASALLLRLGAQAGFRDVEYAATPRSNNTVGLAGAGAANPDVSGVNNAYPSATDPYNSSTAWRTSSVGYGSDILILRHQAVETFPGSGRSDMTMIDCSGTPSTTVPVDRDDRMVSVLYVDVSQGEPSLMCSTGPSTAQPIISGVENFQVLYGVAGVTPNTAPTATPVAPNVADRYLRADQMVVAGNTAATNANWSRVRSLRIGMVLRGAEGSTQQKEAQTFYPLGLAKASVTGTAGSAMSSARDDPGTIFTSPADTRLRQAVTFTIQLRNKEGL